VELTATETILRTLRPALAVADRYLIRIDVAFNTTNLAKFMNP
jgi:hypothetical protein